ncbi:arginine--tRNA ligase [Clostridiales bacterium KA00134]|nr:arginine--tRNA ligase [Clostridiales bacterium KA00134]
MIDFKEKSADLIAKSVGLEGKDILPFIEIPPNFDLGDYAFPAFSLAKRLKKSPVVIAEEIKSSINNQEYFEKIECKGPYLNFFINKNLMAKDYFKEIQDKRENLGKKNIGDGKNVIVEYSSTNIAKPFHIGHIRSTVIGDSIKRIYKFLGYNTIAINHLGDYGTQFGMLIQAYKLWGDKGAIEKDPIPELLKLYIRINQETEDNIELKNECRAWFKKLEDQDPEAVEIWKWFREVSLEEFNRVYKLLEIDFDSYAGESFYSDKMPATVRDLEEKNILTESEGAKIIDLEDENLPPALIIKSDGSTIYLTRDITAAIYRKKTYDFYKNIYVVGSQQNLHFKQLKACLKKMGYDWVDDCIHVAFGMVSAKEGSLSTRRGNIIYLEDVLNRAIDKVKEILDQREKEGIKGNYDKEKLARDVGIGAVKFQELFNQRIKDYVFDWDKILSFEGETAPYVQYVHARINSVLEKGGFDIDAKFEVEDEISEEEINLIRNLMRFTDVVIDAHEKYEPYFITRYIVDIAKDFNKFYNMHKIITDDENVTKRRLLLSYAVKTVIASGLNLLGINAPYAM